MGRIRTWIHDPVTVAQAVDDYEQSKPGARHAVTMPMIAKRYGISTASIINARRLLTTPPTEANRKR